MHRTTFNLHLNRTATPVHSGAAPDLLHQQIYRTVQRISYTSSGRLKKSREKDGTSERSRDASRGGARFVVVVLALMAILVVIVALMAILVVVLVAIRGDRAVKFASLGGGVALERGRDLVGAAIQDAGVAGPERARRGGARPKGQQKGEKGTNDVRYGDGGREGERERERERAGGGEGRCQLGRRANGANTRST